MIIKNLDATFLNIEGEVMKKDGSEDPITLKDVCKTSILNNYKDTRDYKMTGTDKEKAFAIYKALHDANDEVELKTEQITELKKAIGFSYTTIIVGQAFEMIEGK